MVSLTPSKSRLCKSHLAGLPSQLRPAYGGFHRSPLNRTHYLLLTRTTHLLLTQIQRTLDLSAEPGERRRILIHRAPAKFGIDSIGQ